MRWIDIFNPVGTLALILTALNFYLRRRDRKPRLRVEPRLAMRQVRLKSNAQGFISYEYDRCVVINVKNKTDKDIQLDGVFWVPQSGKRVLLKDWYEVKTVLSHDAAEIVMPLEPTPGAWGRTITDKTMPGSWGLMPTRGRFQVRDSIGNVSKSKRRVYDVTKFDSYDGYFSSEEEFSQFLKSRANEISDGASTNPST